MFCSCRISTDKCLAQSLCNSRASCQCCCHHQTTLSWTSRRWSVRIQSRCSNRHGNSFEKEACQSQLQHDGYVLFRRDREGRRGGGVAINYLPIWHALMTHRNFELLWIRLQLQGHCNVSWSSTKPVYDSSALIDYTEASIMRWLRRSRQRLLLWLQATLTALMTRRLLHGVGWISLWIKQLTRGRNCLDRIYIHCVPKKEHLWLITRCWTTLDIL